MRTIRRLAFTGLLMIAPGSLRERPGSQDILRRDLRQPVRDERAFPHPFAPGDVEIQVHGWHPERIARSIASITTGEISCYPIKKTCTGSTTRISPALLPAKKVKIVGKIESDKRTIHIIKIEEEQ